MRLAPRVRPVIGIATLAPLLLSGCALLAGRHRPVTAASLYQSGHKAMVSDSFKYASKQFQALTAQFPFTTEARQARLDLIYVYYREGDTSQATQAANDFLREDPTNPRIDYAWYMKGLVNFPNQPFALERWFGVKLARRPPTTEKKAIDAFNTVVTRFPHSIYAPDARRRIIYLRNLLANYQINVARYYVKRGAYLAAARRAESVVAQYDGAPAEKAALAIMVDCYQRLGLTQLAAATRRVYRFNYSGASGSELLAAATHKSWWHFW